MNTLEHARSEWAFFKRMKQRGRTVRRLWALHYARVRGWTDHGPLLVTP